MFFGYVLFVPTQSYFSLRTVPNETELRLSNFLRACAFSTLHEHKKRARRCVLSLRTVLRPA